MIGKIIFKAIDFAFGLAISIAELHGDAKRLARRVRERLLPTDEPEPIPLPWRDVEHQRAQMRQATTGAARVRAETIRPPPRGD